jgi:hypothetical protein
MAYPKSNKLPWFMIPIYRVEDGTLSGTGLSSNLIITTDTIPSEVSDTKQLNFSEQQLPGGYTSVYKFGSAGARKISFKLEIADFNNDVGLGLKLAQFDLLRRPEIYFFGTGTDEATDITKFASNYKPFYPPPYVIYYNSIFNQVPLPFQVLKCDWVSSKPNRIGKPQYAVIDFELAQLEAHPLSIAEDKAKKVLAIIGALGQSLPNLIKSLKSGKSKQNVYKSKVSKIGF